MIKKKQCIQIIIIVILSMTFAAAGETCKEDKEFENETRSRSLHRHPIVEEIISKHPRFRGMDEELKELNLRIRELIRQYRDGDEEEKEAIKEDLKSKLHERFDRITELHGSMIDEAQERLEKLSDKLEKRLENKEEIVRRELEGLLKGRFRRGEERPERPERGEKEQRGPRSEQKNIEE